MHGHLQSRDNRDNDLFQNAGIKKGFAIDDVYDAFHFADFNIHKRFP